MPAFLGAGKWQKVLQRLLNLGWLRCLADPLTGNSTWIPLHSAHCQLTPELILRLRTGGPALYSDIHSGQFCCNRTRRGVMANPGLLAFTVPESALFGEVRQKERLSGITSSRQIFAIASDIG